MANTTGKKYGGRKRGRKLWDTLNKKLESMYQNDSLSIEQKLLSSIFSEKLIFERDKYRPLRINKGFRHI